MPTAMEMLRARLGIGAPQSYQDPELNSAKTSGLAGLFGQTAQQPELQRQPGSEEGVVAGTMEQPPVIQQQEQPQSQQSQLLNYLNSFEAQKQKRLAEYLNSQKSGMQQLNDVLKLKAQEPAQLDLSPLAALSDSISGGKLLSGYKKPQSNEAVSQSAFDNLNKLQQEKNALSGLAIKSEPNMAQLAAAQKADDKNQLMKERIDLTNHRFVMGNLAKNPQLTQRLSQIQNLDNALSLVTDASHVTPEAIQEMQQAVRSNLGLKGTSGVDERAGTFLRSLGLNAERWNEFLSGSPAQIASSNEILQHVKELAQIERKNAQKQYGSRIKAVTSGFDSMYGRRPDLKADLNNAVSSYLNQTETGKPTEASGQDPKIQEYAKQYGLDYSHAEAILKKRGYGR